MKYLLEVCVDSVESALAAKAGGADRLEVCAGLCIGGITPSEQLVKQILDGTSLPVRVLIRPRFGDFCYSEYEREQMEEQIPRFLQLGAEGIVIGVLNPEGDLDMQQMNRLCQAGAGGKITLHRAFDMCRDKKKSLREAQLLGIDTVLTSGGAESCAKGKAAIEGFLREKERPAEIMAGAGLNADVLYDFLQTTEVYAFHMSGKTQIDSPMKYRQEGVHMGLPGISEYVLERTEEAVVRRAKDCMERFGQSGGRNGLNRSV